MGISISILLIAAGAILTWAVDWSTEGVNLHAVGVIVFVVGPIRRSGAGAWLGR